MKIAIYGYGNLGRGVECALRQAPDAECVGVFTRRPPESVQTVLGAPVTFDPTADIKAERVRIAHALMEGVTDLACALPRHTVVPYRNMAKHLYPTNIPQEATHEITRR